jgi:AcrR family transcriptional regulator
VATRLRRAEQVERNRDAVLAAAKKVFSRSGYAGATLDAIADEAGFSKGVVYSQFGSKPDLFLALLEQRIADRAAENERHAEHLSGAEGVRELLRLAAKDAAAEADWARLLVEFRTTAGRDRALNRRYGALHQRTVDSLASLLRRLHEREGVEPAFALQTMAEFILALGPGVSLERWVNPSALTEEDLIPMLTRALGFER